MRLHGRDRFTSDDIALLASEPFVHQDYRDHLFDIYEEVSRRLAVPTRAVMLTGSAFTGQRFSNGQPFAPGVSDLDVAVVDRDLFRELLLCASRATSYFRDQTPFKPARGHSTGTDTFKSFRSYAFNRGIVRPDLMPDCPAKDLVESMCNDLTNKYIEIFSKISVSIYGDEEYFVAKSNSRGAA